MAEEATIQPDGSQTFDETILPLADDTESPLLEEETMEQIVKAGIDPALILGVAVLLFAVVYYFFVLRKKNQDEDEFFSDLDGDKVRKRGIVDCKTEYNKTIEQTEFTNSH